MTHSPRSREHARSTPSHRHERLEELFREELKFLVEYELQDPILEQVLIHRVTFSHRGARANIWLSSRASDPDLVLEALTRARGFLRFRLSDAIPLKRTPELRFHAELRPFEAEDISSAPHREAI